MAHIAARATRGSHIKVFGPPKFPNGGEWKMLMNPMQGGPKNRANVSRGRSLQTWKNLFGGISTYKVGPKKKH